MTGGSPAVLRAARLFDGTRFVDEPVVLVDGATIGAVGGDVPPDLPVDDLGDVTLLPGFVDCHQHLVFDGSGTLEDQVAGRTDAELLARARAAARRALLGGVTTVRDLGDRSFVTLDLRGDPDLPTILCSGPPITLVDGHCWYLGGECDGRDDLISAVRERIARGCDTVKVMVSGGFLTPATPMWKSQFELDDLRLVVGEARAAGLSVAAHCHGLQAIGDAIEAGVDTIEHCSFLDERMEVSPGDDLLERIAVSTTAISATLGRTPGGALPELFHRILPEIHAALGRVHTLGGRVVVGTDAGIDPYKLHDVAPYAIDELTIIGMSPTEALQALTLHGADTLGLPTKGRIAQGADADLVAVRGDPLTDPAALTRIEQVWKAGTPVRRDARQRHRTH